MKFFFYLFFIFFASINNAYTNKIAVVDIEYIINNYSYYKDLILKISDHQKYFNDFFKNEEKILIQKMEEIESSKFILNESELNIQKDSYNIMLNEFKKKVSNYNNHFDNEININRNIILNEIFQILENYANNNKIELIFDSKNYILASNNINVTNIILEEINKVKLVLDFEQYSID